MVRDLAAHILGGMEVMNFEPSEPVRLVVHTGPIGLAGILLQEDP